MLAIYQSIQHLIANIKLCNIINWTIKGEELKFEFKNFSGKSLLRKNFVMGTHLKNLCYGHSPHFYQQLAASPSTPPPAADQIFQFQRIKYFNPKDKQECWQIWTVPTPPGPSNPKTYSGEAAGLTSRQKMNLSSLKRRGVIKELGGEDEEVPEDEHPTDPHPEGEDGGEEEAPPFPHLEENIFAPKFHMFFLLGGTYCLSKRPFGFCYDFSHL